MVLGVGLDFEEVPHQEAMALGVAQVIAVELHRAAMVLGTLMVPMGELHQVAMVLGTPLAPMEQQPTAVMTIITAEPITEPIILQRLSTLIQQVVLVVVVGMQQEPRPQER
jgi:hypothetical protein